MSKVKETPQYQNVDWVVKHLAKIIEKDLTCYGKHSLYNVFDDLLDVMAIAINNNLGLYNQELEDRYFKHYDRYGREWMFKAQEALTAVACFFGMGGHDDLLGKLFHQLELHNKYRGQFFTPYSISYMMAQINLSGVGNVIGKQGYASVLEPACGSGGMVIACAQVLRETGFNLSKQFAFVAQDIDGRAVKMAYVQTALAGVPCLIRKGNTLTNEFSSEWHTPAFLANDGFSKIYDNPVKKQRVRTV